jgi:predicted outer membrane protein
VRAQSVLDNQDENRSARTTRHTSADEIVHGVPYRFAAELAPIAAAEGIQQPNILDYGRRVRLSHMRLQHGLDFDEGYINDQIASHQEALSMHEMMTSSQENPRLRVLAEHVMPLVRENLAQLQAIQRKTMMSQ